MKQLARVADNIVVLLVRQFLTWTLTAVLMVFFLPRALGDEGLGKITFAIALITILLVTTNLGTATFTVKQVALDGRRLSDLLWTAYAVRLTLGIVIGGALALAVHLSGMDGESKTVLTVAGLILLVMGLDAAQVAAIQGLEDMRWIAFAEVANKSTLMVLGIAVFVTGHGVVAYALVMLVGVSVGFVVNVSYLARRHLRRPKISATTVRYLLVGGFPFFLTGAIMQVFAWADTVVLRFMTEDAVVGWYGAARQLSATLNFIPLVIGTAMLPALTRFHAQDRETMRVAVEKGMLAVLTTAVPMAAAMAMLSGDLIGFLNYPSEFENSVPLLALLALTLPITGSLMLIGTIVIAADRQKQWAAMVAIGTVVNLAINIPLISVFDRAYGNGAIGLVIAADACEVLLIGIGVRLLPEGLIGRSVFLALVRSVAASLVMLAAMGGLKLAFDPGLLPLVVVGGVVYAMSLLAVKGVTLGELRFLLTTALSRSSVGAEQPSIPDGRKLSPGTERV